MSSYNSENSISFADKLKFCLSLSLFFIGFFCFCLFGDKSLYIRLLLLFVSTSISILFFIFNRIGNSFFIFARESLIELRLVSWPDRKESLKMTMIVFGFAFVVSLFIFFTDKCIELLLYGLFLRWK